MSLISSLLAKLFGKDNGDKQKSLNRPASAQDYMNRIENERNERIKSREASIKNWMLNSVREKGNLAFSWESGSDEAFVTFKDSNEAEQDNYEDLEQYIIDKLDIPDAGEFKMNGNGTIYIDGDLVKAKYASTMKGIIDYDEATETEIYSEEIVDSGDKVLFAI